MFFVDLIAWVIFTYLAYFLIYNFVIIFNSSNGRLSDVGKKDHMSMFQQDLTIIIYSHNDSYRVKELIELLNNQDYAPGRYSINVLLDNCDEENIKLLEIIGYAKLWRINTDIKPIGKFKALAWLSERILTCENTNAFVFISAEHKIKSDFLQKVNSAVYHYPVILGETIIRKNRLLNKITNLKNKLKNRVLKHGRFYSGLGNIIDSEILIIRQEILEKIRFKTTDYGFEEYEYSLYLKRNNIPVLYSGDIIAVKPGNETLQSIALKEGKKRYKSFITFRNHISLLFSNRSFALKELILSLVYPSNTTFVLLNLGLIFISINYNGTLFAGLINPKFLTYFLLSRFIAEIYSMISVRCGFNEYRNAVIMFFYTPITYTISIFSGLFKNTNVIPREDTKKKIKAETLHYEKHMVDATITNGKKELPCTLEIRKTDEYVQVIFMFRDKKLVSSKQPRVNYAVEEIVQKLKGQGFAVKICLNCGYFYSTESTVSHSDGEKGYCLYNNFNNSSKEKEYSCVWDSCFNIIPSQANNYILQQVGIEKSKPRV